MDESKTGGGAGTSTQQERSALKKSISARDFYEDGSGSLLPNSFVPRHRPKPSRALEEALEFRRQQKLERTRLLASARQQSELIAESNTPEHIADKLKHTGDELDEEIMVGKFMRGEHYLVNDADVQRKQLDRESAIYAESIKVIEDSVIMQNDYETQHIGKVVIPDDTPEQKIDNERQGDYIYKINSRMGLFDLYKSLLVEVMRLQDCCNKQEEEALFLIDEVEKGRKTQDFQWQLERNNRIKQLRAKTAVDSEDLDHARMRTRSIRKEIDFKFPEMSSSMFFEEEKDAKLDLTEDVNPDDPEAETFRDAGKSVYAWIIGRLTYDGKICCMLFAQFSRDVEPPADGWVFIGKNLDRNLVTTTTLTDESVAAAQKSLADGGVTSIAESDHVMTEQDMFLAKDDIMQVTPVTVPNDSYKAATNQKPSETLIYQVSGSSIYNVNGRYLEFGQSCSVAKYRNLRGWSVYRVALLEIPDLGILAENCYSALKGPPISVILDRNANRAFGELVDRVKEIKEGTVHFKRRFAEMSRSGQRIINTDQTSQLYRNEQLRADARSESDKMMMMILQAVSSSGKDEEDTGAVVAKSSPVHRPVHMRPIAEDEEGGEEDDNDDREDEEGEGDEGTYQTEEKQGSNQSVSSHHSKMGGKSTSLNVSKRSRSNQHNRKKKQGGGSVVTNSSSQSENDDAMRNQGYITGVDLEIKVTLSRGIHYQSGSQGFPLARRRGFLEEEAELSSLVTKCIEAREEEVFNLRIESEKVMKVYLETEGLLRDLDTDAILNDMFRQMRKVRESTLLTAEALGAWARLCYKEKNKGQKFTVLNANEVVDPKSLRTYCVIIAFKGPEIYPQSQEMKSQAGRWNRGLEKAKVATNFRYIGEYKTMEEALQSFSESTGKLQPEQLLPEDSQGARAVVGLRSCGKHFLVRSNSVPNNTPCECCRTKLLAAPDLVAPSALQDPTENLQQFIWHGVDYLEKLWTDVDFLDNNILLKNVFPEFDVKYNPLLLLPTDFGDVLNEITVQDGKILEYLKGRQEQVRDAAKSGTLPRKNFTDRELSGLPYRTNSNQLVDLDKEAATLEAEKLTQEEFQKFLKSSPTSGALELPNLLKSTNGLDSLRPPLPTSPLSGVRTSSGIVATNPPNSTSIPSPAPSALPFTPWSSLSPRSALETPEIMGRILPGASSSSQSMVQFSNRAVSWLEEDHLDFVGKNRLMRSFHILAQSSTLTKHMLPEKVVPSKLKESVLKRKKILRSTSNPGLLGMATKREIPEEDYVHNDDKIKTIETEVGYFFRGAFFAVPQMRPPLSHRIDDVWCRSDVGEWYGMSKGRKMRSFEFQENVKLQGRLKNEERKRLQMLIRRHIEADIVQTNIAAIKDLIAKSKEIRGSVLALDVIQAEQFLKYRVRFVVCVRKMQAMARGCIGRRRVRRMRAEKKRAANRVKQVETDSIALSRTLVPQLIQQGASRAFAQLTASRFRTSINLSGVVNVLTIRRLARSSKKGFELCPACNRQQVVKVYDRTKKCFRSEAAACTCRWWQGEEIWSVQIFDPLLRRKEVITLTMSQVRKHIELITAAAPLMRPEYRQQALIGRSFDRLLALFDASFVTFDGQLEHSNSLARRRAAEESCTLPLVPRSVADDVLEASRRRADKRLTIDRILPFGFQTTVGPLTVTAIDHFEDATTLQQWEPITDFEFAQRHVNAVKHHITILEARVVKTRQILKDSEANLRKYITRNFELDTMRYEDSRTAFLRLDEDIKNARERIERAMHYQKEGITSFQQEEANVKLDWKQSYDDLEDGNAWEGLNNCRKLERKWPVVKQHYHECCAKVPSLTIERKRLVEQLADAHRNAELAVAEALQYTPTLDKAMDVMQDIQQLTKAAVKNSVAVLCMPKKRRWPNQRRVQRMPYRNVFIRDPNIRAQKENISLWNLMERRVMNLRPILRSFTGKAYLRCIVEIYRDPVTKFVMVRINQEEQPVEEAMQHIDMNIPKTELSDMTNSALDTDILLRPSDVKAILSKPPNWPAVHLKEEAYVFKAIDCFVRAGLSAMSADGKDVLESEAPSEELRALEVTSSHVKEEPAAWIPPSKRPRSLEGVKVHPTKGGSFQTMTASYATRRLLSDFSEVETARNLMTYLRLHPYTGRPCLGLMHFLRRQHFVVKTFIKCRWYLDLAKGMPSTWNNEVLDEHRNIGGRLWKIKTRSSLDSFELRLQAHVKKNSLTIVIPFEDVLKNLAVNNPILLGSLLCETMINRYSSELHNTILDFIDLQLPGEEQRRFWRPALFGEMPRLEYQQAKSSKFRGPIYKTHKFFSGRYLEAVFRLTANFDLRIELGPPTDGNFWGHVYTGEIIIVDISYDELRAFFAKVATMENLIPPSYFGTLKILHPNNWLHLFPLLLDLVILRPSAVSGDILNKDVASDLQNEDNAVNSATIEAEDIITRLCNKVNYVVEKFNAWALKTKGHCQPLKPEIIDSVMTNIKGLNSCMPWSLEFKKDDVSRKLVEVRSEVWKSKDLQRFTGKYDYSYRESKEALLSVKGTNSRRHFHDNKSVEVGTSGTGDYSFWSVRILADESKVTYFMDVATVKDTNSTVENLLAEEETLLMMAEDEISIKAERVIQQVSLRCEIVEEMERINRRIKEELMPSIHAAQKEVAETKRGLKKIGKSYIDAVDTWFMARARLVYDNATKSLSVKTSKGVQLFFAPGSFAPEPKLMKEKVVEATPAKEVPSRKSGAASGKIAFTPVVAKRATLPRNIQITLKKFDKIVTAFQLDIATRTNADVSLLSSNRIKSYTAKRPARTEVTFYDHDDYSSAWLPRYDLIEDSGTSFRDADQWCHYAFTSKPSKTETRVLKIKRKIFLVSDPVVGPFDIVGFTLYDSSSSQSWSAILAAGGDLPKFGHAPKPQKPTDDGKKASKSDASSLILIGDKSDMQPFHRLCARRLVWSVVTKATINVVIASNIEELEQQQGLIEEDIAANLDHLEKLREQLELMVTDTHSSGFAALMDDCAEDDVEDTQDEESQLVLQTQASVGIAEIVHHSVQYFRDSGHGIKAYGMMIPADEALDGIPIVVYSQDWLRLCRHYLGDVELNRRFTSSAFIWSRESDAGLPTANVRANRWIEEYDRNFGWRQDKTSIIRMRKQIREETKMHGGNHAPYTSNVVLLLRYGEKELPMLTKWLKDRYDEYAPMRELRRQKEGREREFRISNHQKFCNYVFFMASSFQKGIEAIFNERSSVNTELVDKYHHEEAATSYFCRVLLSRFLSLRLAADANRSVVESGGGTESSEILDEAFLIDTDFVHPVEDTLLRFDALPDEACLTDRDGILQWDPTAYFLDPLESPLLNRPDLQPRVGQVVYAIYKLHCFDCKRAANICKFPGCRCIRLDSAAAIMHQLRNDSSSPPPLTIELAEIGGFLPELKGTGSHPIEKSIRHYLLKGRDLHNQLLPVLPEKPVGVSPSEEIKLEESVDEAEVRRLEMIEYLRVTWQALEKEGHEFRYVSRRYLRPELSSVLTPEDVLDARGGLKASQDDAEVDARACMPWIPKPPRLNDVASTAAPDANAVATKTKTTTITDGTTSTASLASDDASALSVTGGLVKVPNSLMLALLGNCGVDGLGRSVPLWSVDPYPPEQVDKSTTIPAKGKGKEGEVKRPMAKMMFDWMVDHLCVSRPPLLPSPSSGDRGQLLTTNISLKLDRQHCEGTCFLLDGSLVIIQLLFGVLDNSTLCSDDLSGTPPGAIRYCPAHLFPDLHPGLTVVAYDMRAGVTRATALEGRALSRAADAFEVSDDNIPLIACKILEYASLVIRLSRVGEVCTAVAVDVNGVQRQTQFTTKETSIKGRVKPLGRKESVCDLRKERIAMAKKMMMS